MDNKQTGKVGGYLVSLVCAAVLGFYCYSTDKQGKEINPVIFMPLLISLGYGLGIQLDKSELGQRLSNLLSSPQDEGK